MKAMVIKMVNIKDRPFFEQPITVLPGIGKVKAALFAKLGVESVEDLLYHFPRGYQNRGDVQLLGTASMQPIACATVLTIGSSSSSVRLPGGRVMTRFTAFDDSGKCVLTFFNQPYVKDVFIVGSVFRFWGKVEKNGRNFSMSCPEYEPYGNGRMLRDFKSIYPLTQGLNQMAVARAIESALASAEELPDPLPDETRAQYGLVGYTEGFRMIHNPKNYEEMEKARRRFIFEELFLFSLGMQISGKKETIPLKERLKKVDLKPFLSLLSYELTGAQKRTIDEIFSDMAGETFMSRLVCGDVGSGKTVCAAAAAYIALKNGKQAALMVPTEILASQHFSSLSPLFEKLGFTSALLIGSLSASEKRTVRQRLQMGEIDLVIGTQALLTEDTTFSDLALVIADEQHRFGVNQRSALAGKGEQTHTLVMTATPIPRTLALILYKGLDISYIDELPPGRQKVRTYIVDSSFEKRLQAFIRKQAAEGHQTYVVCPTVDNEEDPENGKVVPLSYDPREVPSENPPLKSAVGYAKELSDALPDLSVGFVHGKLKPKEKDAVMTRFAEGEMQVLVSTTVIEVGVNVPNVTLMIIENAERFGLSQLHQLRGRVGRGKSQSYCVLVSDCSEDSTAYKRLQTICKTEKGLEIANEDLKLRGPGDFFPSSGGNATRQSGDFSFRFIPLCTDATMPEKAALSADALLQNDPKLIDHPATEGRMRKLFSLTKNAMN